MTIQTVREMFEEMSEIRSKTVDHKFSQRFLEVAEEFSVVNHEWSEAFSDLFMCEKKSCYMNCQEIASNVYDVSYYEGYVSLGNVDIEHAWLVNEDGEVIEPTIILEPYSFSLIEGYFGVKIPSDYIDKKHEEDSWWDQRIEQAYIDGIW